MASSSKFDPFQEEEIAESTHHNLEIPPTPPTQPQEEFKAEPMTIRVDDPVKSSDGSFITYRVFTMVRENFKTNADITSMKQVLTL